MLVCRSQCGGRGLKQKDWLEGGGIMVSLPVRGARIETKCVKSAWLRLLVAPRAGGAD